jgi:hypothetical protein
VRTICCDETASVICGDCPRQDRVRVALRYLSNEVLASLPLMEPLCRREFGNTNYNLLIQRAEEARAILAED